MLTQLSTDYRTCSIISQAEHKMLAYAEKLTNSLSKISKDDISELRDAGFSDQAILEINAAAAYMNFVNRVADGLGIELEPEFEAFKR